MKTGPVFPVALCAFTLSHCGTPSERQTQVKPEVSQLSSDNGSWGNGSWGNGSWGNGSWGNGSWGNGSWGNGSWGNGSWGNGTWGNGSWGNGTWGNGSWGNGTWGNGTWGNGSWGNGTWGNGSWGNGTWGNGTWGNGSWGNGSWGNGSWGNGMIFDTLAVADLDISNLTDTALTGSACDPSVNTSAAMTELMVYVATIQCALPPPCAENDVLCMSQLDCASSADCRTITDCDGNELYVAGRDGLGTDQSDPSVVANVDDCIDATLEELNNDFRAYADNLNSYAVSCALPESTGGSCGADPGCVEVTYQLYPSGTETIQYYGAIGLAPTWKSNPDFDLDPQGQRRVSACLAARTNPHRKKVQLSIRGVGIPTTATELETYSHHEGAFWGNMFDSNNVVHSCSVNGGGVSGRICTGGQCSFVDEGPCDTACASQDAEGNYTDCGAEGSTDVINTFLPLVSNLVSGWKHTCARKKDGTVWCWGRNNYGQLGDGTTDNNVNAVQVSGISNADEVRAGAYHSCVRKTDGTLSCWGRNYRGSLGDDYSSSYSVVPVQPLEDVAVNSSHVSTSYQTCSVHTNGTVWCWGRNLTGQIGDGTLVDRHVPTQVAGLTGIVYVEAGRDHSCALRNDGVLFCWGDNGYGQLGNGTTTGSATPVAVSTSESFIDFRAGERHTCATSTTGELWCWGRNSSGQLGDDTSTHRSTPVLVKDLPSPVVELSGGKSHNCVILDDDTLRCWGHNGYGQLGIGNTSSQYKPVLVMSDVAGVSAGVESSCAMKNDGSAWCWGNNNYGQLGDGTTTQRTSPVRMDRFMDCGDGVCELGETAAECPADCN